VASCSPCAAKVCAVDNYCCTNQWDYFCLSGPQGVWNSCPELACPKCAHPICQVGVALNPLHCEPCVAQICAQDPFCCGKLPDGTPIPNGTWDSTCVTEVQTICGLPTCGG
jgi:hypothetical protein